MTYKRQSYSVFSSPKDTFRLLSANHTDILVTASNSDYRYPNLHLKLGILFLPHLKSVAFCLPRDTPPPFHFAHIYHRGAHVAAAGRSLGEKALFRIALWTANNRYIIIVYRHLTPTASKTRSGVYHFSSHFCTTSLFLLCVVLFVKAGQQ